MSYDFIYRTPRVKKLPTLSIRDTHFQLPNDASTQPVLNAENINKINGIAPFPSTSMNDENMNILGGIALFSFSNMRDEIEPQGKFRDENVYPANKIYQQSNWHNTRPPCHCFSKS